jgi:AraC-like DNA-binding protein
MPSSSVLTFTEPDAYYAVHRTRRVEGFITESGNFQAELTVIDFDRLWMTRGEETLARVLNLATDSGRTKIWFPTSRSKPSTHLDGLELSPREIGVFRGPMDQHRSSASSDWGAMSLTHEDLAACGEAIIGNPLAAPSFTHRIRLPQPLVARLSNLHEAAAHLAKNAPDILANPEVARAIEQGLIEVMILSLAGGDPVDTRSAHRHHQAVMRRLEDVLQASSREPLYMTELCRAAGASYRTLRDCCQEHLGMSPKRYLWLRRMHLARRALRSAHHETATVTEIATNYGFWELGRFSVTYRTLFGEPPSTALRRPPGDATSGENAAAPWQFAKSA